MEKKRDKENGVNSDHYILHVKPKAGHAIHYDQNYKVSFTQYRCLFVCMAPDNYISLDYAIY
jgi:hypothetical protein